MDGQFWLPVQPILDDIGFKDHVTKDDFKYIDEPISGASVRWVATILFRPGYVYSFQGRRLCVFITASKYWSMCESYADSGEIRFCKTATATPTSWVILENCVGFKSTHDEHRKHLRFSLNKIVRRGIGVWLIICQLYILFALPFPFFYRKRKNEIKKLYINHPQGFCTPV